MSSIYNNPPLTNIKSHNIFWLTDPTILFKHPTHIIPSYDMTKIEQLNALTRFFIYFLILTLMFYSNSNILYIPFIGITIIIILYFIDSGDKYGKNKQLDSILKRRKDDIMDNERAENEIFVYDDHNDKTLNIVNDNDYDKLGDSFDLENKSLFPDAGKYRIETGAYDLEGKLMVGPKSVPPKSILKKYDPLYSSDEVLEYTKNTCKKPSVDNPFMNNNITEYGAGEVPAACNANDEDIKNNIVVNYNHQLFRDVDEIWERENSQRQFYTTPNTAVPNNQTEFAKWLYYIPSTCKENTANCNRWEDLRWKRDNYKR